MQLRMSSTCGYENLALWASWAAPYNEAFCKRHSAFCCGLRKSTGFVNLMLTNCTQSGDFGDVFLIDCTQFLTKWQKMPTDYNNLRASIEKSPQITTVCDHQSKKVPKMCANSDKLAAGAPRMQYSAGITSLRPTEYDNLQALQIKSPESKNKFCLCNKKISNFAVNLRTETDEKE
jgi:hypothetical protein